MNYITALDNEILWILKNNFSGEILNKIAVSIFNLSRLGLIWNVVVLLLLVKKHNRRAAVTVITAMALSFTLCFFIKGGFFNRLPPFLADHEISLLVKVPMGSSFPSIATVLGFSAAVSLSIQKRQWSALAIFFSALTAIAQLYLMVCYPTDILLSIIIGIVFGYIGTFLVNHLIPHGVFLR